MMHRNHECWYFCFPGKVDRENGTITGDKIAYIYCDKETAFLGRFENKLMRAARESEVKVGLIQSLGVLELATKKLKALQ